MMWLARFAVIALALFALGQPRGGVSPAKAPPLRTAPDAVPAPGGRADFQRANPLAPLAVEDGAGRSGGANAGGGGTSASEDSASDDGADTASTATMPRSRFFIAVFTKDQDFGDRSFLAPLKTGPPSA